MKQTLKLIALGSVVAVGIFAGFARTATVEANAGSVNELENSGLQSQLYVSNCARCHGADGKGNTKLGVELDVPDLTSAGVRGMSAAKMTRIITKGDGDMPAFGKKLKAAQIASLVRTVRGLR